MSTDERISELAAGQGARDWRRSYASRLVLTDLLALVWVVVGVQIVWVGIDSEVLGVSGRREEIQLSYTTISIIIISAWMAALHFYDTRTDRVLGLGSAEYKAIMDASIRLFGIVAIFALIFKVDLARGYILLAFPLGVAMLLFSRWMWRQWLAVQRYHGRYSSGVLLVGSRRSVTHIATQLAAQPQAGYRVVGACVPDGRSEDADVLSGTAVPVVGGLTDLDQALAATEVDTVIITSSDELSPEQIRELSWSLEPGRQHLVVAPSLTGVGGPRIHTRPVAGLPLIHVETPRYDGRKILAKRCMDVAGAILLTVALSPLFLLIVVAIRVSSPGPVLFRQQRVGIRGTNFQMLKFRSMVVDAEARLPNLSLSTHDAGNSVMFKMKDDPRVTTIGRFIRRYSLDELPQLLNVLGGSMSLVGPRPPLEQEVSNYEAHVHRRFLVKPGITGLWQVSGRSNLSWEDTVRLDLYYVENWSITADLVILWRTLKAVFARDGAY